MELIYQSAIDEIRALREYDQMIAHTNELVNNARKLLAAQLYCKILTLSYNEAIEEIEKTLASVE